MMSDKQFRAFDFSDEDYETFAAIRNAVWVGDEMTVAELKHEDKTRDQTKYYQKVMGLIDGRVAGIGVYGEAWWYGMDDRYFATFNTHPDCERQGLASAFYHYILDILKQREKFKTIEAFTREDKPEGIRFLENRGFKKMMRYQRSELKVQEFDPAPFAAKVETVQNKGIHITTVAELRERDDDWLYQLWEMESEILKDLPAPDPIKPMPFEQYKKRVTSPAFYPEAYAVAVDNGRYVGCSALWLSEANPQKLYTGLTGVLRSHRRLGLATAMKTKTISHAKNLGIELIETDNEENNPMYQINVQLGFIALPAELEYHKEISQEQ